MQRYILGFGAIAGFLVITPMVLGMAFGGPDSAAGGEVFGYAIMLVALSLVFVAIKRYRDRELGGVIRFSQALGLGIGIAAVAGVAYVAVWEVFLYATDYAFADQYIAGYIEQQRAAGASADELAAIEVEFERFSENYAKPWYRIPLTFSEIFPVGAIVSLISATALRNPRVLPA